MGGRMEKCGLNQTQCCNMTDVRGQGRRASLTGVGENCVGRDELCCGEAESRLQRRVTAILTNWLVTLGISSKNRAIRIRG